MLLTSFAAFIINSIMAILIFLIVVNFYAMINLDFALWLLQKAEELEELAKKRREENERRRKR